MTEPHVTYKLRHDDTAEQARDTRARVWAYIFRCFEAKQKGGAPTTPRKRRKVLDGEVTP